MTPGEQIARLEHLREELIWLYNRNNDPAQNYVDQVMIFVDQEIDRIIRDYRAAEKEQPTMTRNVSLHNHIPSGDTWIIEWSDNGQTAIKAYGPLYHFEADEAIAEGIENYIDDCWSNQTQEEQDELLTDANTMEWGPAKEEPMTD